MTDFLKNKFVIKTDLLDKGVISQSVINDAMGILWESVVNTQDKQIRNALIKLGWTPPAKKKNIKKIEKWMNDIANSDVPYRTSPTPEPRKY